MSRIKSIKELISAEKYNAKTEKWKTDILDNMISKPDKNKSPQSMFLRQYFRYHHFVASQFYKLYTCIPEDLNFMFDVRIFEESIMINKPKFCLIFTENKLDATNYAMKNMIKKKIFKNYFEYYDTYKHPYEHLKIWFDESTFVSQWKLNIESKYATLEYNLYEQNKENINMSLGFVNKCTQVNFQYIVFGMISVDENLDKIYDYNIMIIEDFDFL